MLQVELPAIEQPVALAFELKNEEISRSGFEASQSGQFSLELSSPIDWIASNFLPHLVHWYSYIGIAYPFFFPSLSMRR